ncbi:hypothetical protein X559_0742 [Paenilisteria newyorkensis]|nr:hypothetical protein X559_0742 [Listeria newyorkensis]
MVSLINTIPIFSMDNAYFLENRIYLWYTWGEKTNNWRLG